PEVASRNIAEAAAADANASGVAKLVGDFYATGMDEAAINAAGLAPIQPILDRIDAIASPADIAQYLRDEFAAGRGEVFHFFGEADFKDSSTVIAYTYHGGLSLPEEGYCTEDGKDGADQ